MKQLANKINLQLDSIKETSWLTIFLFSLLYFLHVFFIFFVVFRSNTISNILVSINRGTSGLMNTTLILNLVSIAIFVFILILKNGRLNFSDVGLKKNRLTIAITIVFSLWIFVQLSNFMMALFISGDPTLSTDWSKYGATGMFGDLIGQLFGNALFEEIAFRGFLLVQICKKFKGRKGAIFKGIILSQLVFALIHIPNRILSGMNISLIILSLITVFILGVLFAILYLVTDNLFLAIGIHALVNTPLLVFDGYTQYIFLIALIFIPLVWDRTLGRYNTNPCILDNN